MSDGVNPTALVSWAHRDDDWTDEQAARWRDEVHGFVEALRGSGIDAEVDLHRLSTPGTDWTRYGAAAVRDRAWVIVILSRAWRERWEGRNPPTAGAGVVAEADALRSVFVEDQQAFRNKVVLVALPSTSDASARVPTGLHGVQRLSVAGYEQPQLAELLRLLTGQPRYPAGPLGPIPDLPPAVPGPIGSVRGPGVAGAKPERPAPSPGPDDERTRRALAGGFVPQLVLFTLLFALSYFLGTSL